MNILPLLPLGALVASLPLLSAPATPGVGVGDTLPAPELESFKQTKAESFDDFTGRVILFEFFEYW